MNGQQASNGIGALRLFSAIATIHCVPLALVIALAGLLSGEPVVVVAGLLLAPVMTVAAWEVFRNPRIAMILSGVMVAVLGVMIGWESLDAEMRTVNLGGLLYLLAIILGPPLVATVLTYLLWRRRVALPIAAPLVQAMGLPSPRPTRTVSRSLVGAAAVGIALDVIEGYSPVVVGVLVAPGVWSLMSALLLVASIAIPAFPRYAWWLTGFIAVTTMISQFGESARGWGVWFLGVLLLGFLVWNGTQPSSYVPRGWGSHRAGDRHGGTPHPSPGG